MTRTLTQQFDALPEDIQGRMFRVLDLVIGMDQHEKTTCRKDLDDAHLVFKACRVEHTSALLKSLAFLVWAAEREARPKE